MLKDTLCVMQTLRAASRLVTKRYEAALRSVDLTASQFTILQALTARDEQCLSDVCKTLGFDQTTMTRLLRPMEAKGLITLGPSQEDGRRKILALTKEGSAKFTQALPIWQTVQGESLTHVSGRDWATIRHFLHHLSQP